VSQDFFAQTKTQKHRKQHGGSTTAQESALRKHATCRHELFKLHLEIAHRLRGIRVGDAFVGLAVGFGSNRRHRVVAVEGKSRRRERVHDRKYRNNLCPMQASWVVSPQKKKLYKSHSIHGRS